MRLDKVLLSLSFLVLVALSSCKKDEAAESSATTPSAPAKKEAVATVTPTPAPTPFEVIKTDLGEGLTCEVLAAGTGDDTVVEGKTARLETRLLDVEGKELWTGDFSFTVGTGQAVPGFDMGVQGMKVGEKRRLYIPWKLGYGETGRYPIKPRQDIVYEVVLVEIK